VAVADNDFGFRLLRTLNANGAATNLIVSPISVSQALTMTYNGRAETPRRRWREHWGSVR
jgi:serine protease inhibitor